MIKLSSYINSMKLYSTRFSKLLHILNVPAWREAFLSYRVAAGVEHKLVLRHLGKVQSVIDIGANRGQFALVVRNVFPQATIVSFEPLDYPAAIFRKVFQGDEIVTLHQVAIGPQLGESQIHISAMDDSSSLLPISLLQSQIFPGTAEVRTQTAIVGPLNVFLKPNEILRPALLKLDVQGYEYQALQGCQALISNFDYIYCECSFRELYTGQQLAAEVIVWLGKQGFVVQGVYNPYYDSNGVAVQADFLFVREDVIPYL